MQQFYDCLEIPWVDGVVKLLGGVDFKKEFQMKKYKYEHKMIMLYQIECSYKVLTKLKYFDFFMSNSKLIEEEGRKLPVTPIEYNKLIKDGIDLNTLSSQLWKFFSFKIYNSYDNTAIPTANDVEARDESGTGTGTGTGSKSNNAGLFFNVYGKLFRTIAQFESNPEWFPDFGELNTAPFEAMEFYRKWKKFQTTVNLGGDVEGYNQLVRQLAKHCCHLDPRAAIAKELKKSHPEEMFVIQFVDKKRPSQIQVKLPAALAPKPKRSSIDNHQQKVNIFSLLDSDETSNAAPTMAKDAPNEAIATAKGCGKMSNDGRTDKKSLKPLLIFLDKVVDRYPYFCLVCGTITYSEQEFWHHQKSNTHTCRFNAKFGDDSNASFQPEAVNEDYVVSYLAPKPKQSPPTAINNNSHNNNQNNNNNNSKSNNENKKYKYGNNCLIIKKRGQSQPQQQTQQQRKRR